jgi:hypothetical protein
MAKWDLTATVFPVSASLQAYRRRELGNGSEDRVCCSFPAGGAEAPLMARRLSLGARIRRQARRAAKGGAPPGGRWGFDRSARPPSAGLSCHQCGEAPSAPRLEPRRGTLKGSTVDAITVRRSSDAAGCDELCQDLGDVAGAHVRGVAQLAL